MKELVVAKVDDLKNGEMKEVDLGSKKALLVKENGKFSAIGNKCTHYGAPLVKGHLHNGVVRCPWHGACFNTCTGDIEDFPGLDSVPVYEVNVRNGEVVLKFDEEASGHKRVKLMCKESESNQVFLIIGGGGAAITCAETLRQEGFKGKIIIATKESHPPYDRPKLSKALSIDPEKLYLRGTDFLRDCHINLMLGKEGGLNLVY